MSEDLDIDAIEAAPWYYAEGHEGRVVELCQEVRRLREQLAKAETCIGEHERFLRDVHAAMDNPHLPFDTMMFPLMVLTTLEMHKEILDRNVRLAGEIDALRKNAAEVSS